VKETVARALQFAESDVRGPVYVVAGREVLAEEIENSEELELETWGAVGPAALPEEAVEMIGEELVGWRPR
jgi:thiamine pyrophosphate-dependent acetolactate synthase large subunit-like protein